MKNDVKLLVADSYLENHNWLEKDQSLRVISVLPELQSSTARIHITYLTTACNSNYERSNTSSKRYMIHSHIPINKNKMNILKDM